MRKTQFRMPLADIISIGEELLIGQTINTNAALIASGLNSIGVSVRQIIVITDKLEDIKEHIRESVKRADFVILTGGLGPTRDDVTKNALFQYFGAKLMMNESILSDIIHFFKNRGLEMTELNRQQALVPGNAIAIHNPYGTAPGLWFEDQHKIIVSMPGVPHEMQHMLSSYVIPTLKKKMHNFHILHKTVLTSGIGESFLADLISSWEDALPGQIQLAYLPSPGMVKLRLSGRGRNRQVLAKQINQEIRKLRSLIPQYIWGYDDEKLEEKIGQVLRDKKQSLSTAESCTGGYIAHKITGIPGSSDYFKGSVIAYDNQIKQELLSVNRKTLARHGAVSKEVVECMARNVRQLMKTHYALAVSGIAGPGGGTDEKPVGTVWVAVASDKALVSKKICLGGDRSMVITRAGMAALDMLYKFIRSVPIT